MITDEEFYYWSTEESHPDNTHTMSDFLDSELDDSFSVHLVDGTYAEIVDEHLHYWEVHASGNGDFFSHKVQFVPMGFMSLIVPDSLID